MNISPFVCECGTGCENTFSKEIFYPASDRRNELEVQLGKALFIISSNCQEQFDENSKTIYSSEGYFILEVSRYVKEV